VSGAQENKKEGKRYNTFNNINRRVYIFGLKPNVLLIGVAGILFVQLACLLLISSVVKYFIGLIPTLVILSFLSKIRKENSNGAPDYMSSLVSSKRGTKNVIDGGLYLSTLKTKRDAKNV
jgi:hypothetical protein